MAITGTFTADFSSFQTAVEQASVTLTKFEANSTKVETSLGKMSNALSGTKLIADATLMAEAVDRIGGVSKLTETELTRLGATAQEAVDKMKALGQAVPPGIQNLADRARGASEEMLRLAGATTENATATSGWSTALSTATGVLGAFGIQASIGGVVAFGKSIFETASQIHDMGERLGISSEAVQGFKFAADQAGSSMDAVGTAITKMNKNLAEGDKGTVDALKKAGLEFQAIRAMSPEDAFLAIADAMAKMPDPMEQSDVALKLFGKGAAELLPAIKEGFRAAAEGAQKMSNETVNALEMAEDAWQKFGNSVKIVTGTAIAGVIKSGEAVGSSWKDFTQFLLDAAQHGVGLATAMALARQEVEKTVDFVGPIQKFAQGTHQTKEEAEAAAKAYQKWADATKELESAGSGWQGTLDTIDGEVVEAIKYYLAAGVAQGKLADAYDLTDTQIKAITLALEAQKKADQDLAKQLAASDAMRMTSFTNQIKAMETMAASSLKAYGTEEAIAALQRLDAQELALTKSVYDNITSEKDRMKLIEEYGAKHAEITAKIIDLENKRAKVVNDQVIAELDAQKQLNAAYGLTASGGIAAQETALDKLTQGLTALHLKKVEGIDQTNQENLLYKQYTDALLTAAQADDRARDAVAAHNTEVAKVPGIMAAAEAATKSYAAAASAQTPTGGATGGAFQQASFGGYVAGSGGFKLPQFKIPSYAEGGLGDFGAGTLALLHGKEAIVPLDRDPTAVGPASVSATVDTAESFALRAKELAQQLEGINARQEEALVAGDRDTASALARQALDIAQQQQAIVAQQESALATTGPVLPADLTSASSGGPSLVQNITIYVNGTAADVARKVSDEIMKTAMRGQQFGAF